MSAELDPTTQPMVNVLAEAEEISTAWQVLDLMEQISEAQRRANILLKEVSTLTMARAVIGFQAFLIEGNDERALENRLSPEEIDAPVTILMSGIQLGLWRTRRDGVQFLEAFALAQRAMLEDDGRDEVMVQYRARINEELDAENR